MRWVGIVLGLGLLSTGSGWAQSAYTVTDLGTFLPVQINASGTIAGNGSQGAAYWTPATGVVNIPTPAPGGAFALNDPGWVVGNNGGCSVEPEEGVGVVGAWVWSQADGFRCLSRIERSDTWPTGVNNRGEIVGAARQEVGGHINCPLYWASPTSEPVCIPGAVSNGFLSAIAHNGVAVGFYQDNEDVAFTWSAAKGLTPLEPFGVPLAINLKGTVVGEGGGVWWPDGTFFLLGHPRPTCTQTDALSVNVRGDVVGESQCGGESVAWVWGTKTGFTELPDLERAVSINAKRQIVGVGRRDGVWHGLLLTPKTVP